MSEEQKQPPAIDPGEGWELLPVGTIREIGDQLTRDRGENWELTVSPGFPIHPGTSLTYRRRKPAEVWPKWYVCDSWGHHAYIRRDSKTEIGEIMRKEGVAESGRRKWEPSDDYNVRRRAFVEVTEAEALARVTAKPAESHLLMNCQKCGEFLGHWHECKPVESPDDWVEITDENHKLRAGIDQMHCAGDLWVNVDVTNGLTMQGRTRCRRRDLPAAKPKRIPVRLYWYDGNIVGRYDHSPPTDPSFQELLHDADGFYVTEGER